MTTIAPRLTTCAGALLGAGAALVLLVGARPSSSFTTLPASVRVSVPLTGELEVQPAAPRPVLAVPALLPGARPATATVTLRNQTGRTLAVDLRARAAARDLDGLLRVRLRTGGRTLADTTLQGLRHGTGFVLRLPSGARRTVRLQAWIPAAITDGFQGRSVAVTLVPAVRVGG